MGGACSDSASTGDLDSPRDERCAGHEAHHTIPILAWLGGASTDCLASFEGESCTAAEAKREPRSRSQAEAKTEAKQEAEAEAEAEPEPQPEAEMEQDAKSKAEAESEANEQ